MEGKWTKEAQGPLGPCPTRVRMEKYAPAMAEALEKAAAKFREYERLHRAKNTVDGAMKAISNASMAAEIEALLTAIKGE